MKLVRNVVIVAVAALFAGACTDFHRPGVAFMPVPVSAVQGTFADLELGSEIEGEASASCLFGFLNIGAPNKILDENPKTATGGLLSGFSGLFSCKGETLAKRGAAYNAAESGGFQYVVAARYEITTKDYLIFKKITAKVMGIGANVKSVSTLPMEALFPGVEFSGGGGSSVGVSAGPEGPGADMASEGGASGAVEASTEE